MADPEITLLVCTSGRETLPAALGAIARLDMPAGVGVETVVVDNSGGGATTDAASELRERRPAIAVRLLEEPRRGVAHARRRGIAAARGKLVAFVDDDCLVAPDWLRQVLAFAARRPRAGVIGGRNELRWERAPSHLAIAYGESLARQDWGPRPLRLDPRDPRCPCGAGLVLRRDAVLGSGWLDHGRLRGRHPRLPGAGEDTEVALMVRAAGWEVWYAPELRVSHLVSEGRTGVPHMLWLHYGFGRAEIYLRLLARGLPLDGLHRRLGIRWALGELGRVLGRFPLGFVRYRDERPTWLIRLAWALGCVDGAVALLVRGRVS